MILLQQVTSLAVLVTLIAAKQGRLRLTSTSSPLDTNFNIINSRPLKAEDVDLQNLLRNESLTPPPMVLPSSSRQSRGKIIIVPKGHGKMKFSLPKIYLTAGVATESRIKGGGGGGWPNSGGGGWGSQSGGNGNGGGNMWGGGGGGFNGGGNAGWGGGGGGTGGGGGMMGGWGNNMGGQFGWESPSGGSGMMGTGWGDLGGGGWGEECPDKKAQKSKKKAQKKKGKGKKKGGGWGGGGGWRSLPMKPKNQWDSDLARRHIKVPDIHDSQDLPFVDEDEVWPNSPPQLARSDLPIENMDSLLFRPNRDAFRGFNAKNYIKHLSKVSEAKMPASHEMLHLELSSTEENIFEKFQAPNTVTKLPSTIQLKLICPSHEQPFSGKGKGWCVYVQV